MPPVMRRKPAAVLVLRVWCEGEDRDILRARITQTGDITQPGTAIAVAGTVDDVSTVVRDWIEAFATSSDVNPRTST
jgi:hypothetical protein